MKKDISNDKEDVFLKIEQECFIYLYCEAPFYWAYLSFSEKHLSNWQDELIILLKKMKNFGCPKNSIKAKVIFNMGAEVFVDLGGFENTPDQVVKRFGIDVSCRYVNHEALKIKLTPSKGEIQYKETVKERVFEKKQRETAEKIKVMIVDDSKTVRNILKKIFDSNPRFDVVGMAENPIHAEELREQVEPDVMTLDINMPKMTGMEYQKKILKNTNIKTIIVSAYSVKKGHEVLECMENGAFDYIQKPDAENFEESKAFLIEKVIYAYESAKKVKVRESISKPVANLTLGQNSMENSIVLLGISTGGVEALTEILPTLPKEFPPILVTIHMPVHFTRAFAERLNTMCKMHVAEAQGNETLETGHIYLAPGGRQMKIRQVGDDVKVVVTDDPPVNKFAPSVDYLFDSALRIQNKYLVAVLMTGMGRDGAEGLLRLKDYGADTVIQDEETSIVYGMPGAAAKLGAHKYEASLQEIPGKIAALVSRNSATQKLKKIS